MLQQYPFTASPHSIALFFRGKMRNIPSTDPSFPELYDHLKNPQHDEIVVERLVDKAGMIERLMVGDVKVRGSTVFYKDTPIHTALAEKLLSLLDAGFAAENWARFLSKVMANPSDQSRDSLYNFLAHWNAPVTEDGCFIAFKKVRPDYRDIHSGTMDNSPGQVVEMARENVNPDPNQTCSYGLHVAATSYLSTYSSSHGYRVIACKVDPVDVVAVPKDYNGAKMRVCRYLVLGEAEESFVNTAAEMHVYCVGDMVITVIQDVQGRRICEDAVTFSEDWKRDIHADISEGTTVAPTAYSGDDLPPNKFMVGVVTASVKNDEGQYVDVTWQDGSTSSTLCVDRATPLNSDVVAVTYVGVVAEPEEDTIVDDGEPDEDVLSMDDTDVDDGYCDECGDATAESGGLCADCFFEKEEAADAELQKLFDDIDEADHIAETGLTTGGVPVSLEEQRAAARFLTPLTSDDRAYVPTATTEKTFVHCGVTYTASGIKDSIEQFGQRGYARLSGVPRTTLQEWLKAI